MQAADPPAPPGAGHNLQDAQVVIDLFERASEANLQSVLRKGSTVYLPPRQQLLMTGDLHDNGLNLQRLLKLAALHEGEDRHVVLHEIVHSKHFINNLDLSVRTLARVAALKVQYPEQVHILQSNHELSQIVGEGISKNGIDVVRAFDEGVEYIYGEDGDAVNDAVDKYIRSLLLAVRCPNGVFCCHSVPSPRYLERFDQTVTDRVPTQSDLEPRGAAYDMVWGRNHTPEQAQELANRWGVELFVMGHQPAEMGYNIETRTMLVLASDHDHGMALPLSTSKHYDMDSLIEALVPLASVVV